MKKEDYKSLETFVVFFGANFKSLNGYLATLNNRGTRPFRQPILIFVKGMHGRFVSGRIAL
ncbi:MAG: hypothetical protein R6X34_26280 [Chloroflexota bacterium]